MATTPCRECDNPVSYDAAACPGCGAPKPYEAEFTGYGFEYKSRRTLLGLPLVHVSFKYRKRRPGGLGRPVVARGWLAIGQFSCGFVNISQFGLGPFCIGQFALAGACLSQISVAGIAVSQITAAYYGICQAGVICEGFGVRVLKLPGLL
ncbi:MAG: zinc ribbon domain-containing protein [Planctomycetota bacterium]